MKLLQLCAINRKCSCLNQTSAGELKIMLFLKATTHHLWRLLKMDICKCHWRRSLYQFAVWVFIILLQFNFKGSLNLSLCVRFERLSSFPAVIRSSLCGIRKIQACTPMQRFSYWLIYYHTQTRVAPFECFSCFKWKILRQQSHPWHHPKRKIPSMPRLVWDITREINHRNALCCTQRRGVKKPRQATTTKKISQHS